MLVDPRRVGYWAPGPDEPLSHFEAKLRLREILEKKGFAVYPEYQLDPYTIKNLGDRQYREDLYIEHKTIPHWKFFVEVHGGYHFASYKQKKKTEFRAKEIKKHEHIHAYQFTVEELIGKHRLDDHQIMERINLAVF